MKTYIQDLKDITDSREMLESKPHFFLAWFAYILIGILVVALIWAYFGQIEDYVKATGTVRPGEKISTIRNMVTGRVDEVYFEQGMKVKEGDVLYRIEIDGLISEKEQLERKVNRLETENNNLIKLKNSILENKNLFDNENIDEIDFYNRYRKYETDRLVSIEQYENQRVDMLVQTENELSINKSNLDNAQVSLRNIEINIDNSSVKASIDGIVNVYSEISTGDFLQGGVEIATIVPDVSTEYRVQLMVPNENIAEVELGQKIKYHFHALPFREYGEAEGIVQKISNDSRVDSETGISYYVVEATLEETKMESYKGDIREVKVGMACEAQVVTKSRSILRWLLEKINLRD